MACLARHSRPSVVPGSLDDFGKVMIGNKVIFAHANQNKKKQPTKMPLLKPILTVWIRMSQNVLACSSVRPETGSEESQHHQGFSVYRTLPMTGPSLILCARLAQTLGEVLTSKKYFFG